MNDSAGPWAGGTRLSGFTDALGPAGASGRRTGLALKIAWRSVTRASEVSNRSRSCCKGGLSLVWGQRAPWVQAPGGVPDLLPVPPDELVVLGGPVP